MAFVMNSQILNNKLGYVTALVRFCAWEVNIVYSFLSELLAYQRAADKPVLLVVSFGRIALLIYYPSLHIKNLLLGHF